MPATLGKGALITLFGKIMGADRNIYWLRTNQINVLPTSSDYEWAFKLMQLARETTDCGHACSWRYGWVTGWYEDILKTGKDVLIEDVRKLVQIIQILEPTDFHDLPQLPPLFGERIYALQLCSIEDRANADCFVLSLEQSNQISEVARGISVTRVLTYLQERTDSSRMERTEDQVYRIVRGLAMGPGPLNRHLVSSVIW
jgi:hypothetical protein